MRLRGDRSPSPGRKSGEREDLCAAGLATRGRLPDIRNVAVLDAAVAAAYGWPLSITDENALREALALNGRSSVTRGRRVVDAGVVVAGRDADRLSQGLWHFLNFFPLPHGQGSLARTPAKRARSSSTT